jgi:Periplasmic copper-binding protein (NosD)
MAALFRFSSSVSQQAHTSLRMLSLAAVLVLSAPCVMANGTGGGENENPIVVDANATPCIKTTVHFTSITLAIAAAPPGAIINVCPGKYPEQLKINKSLTLQGVPNPSANAGAAVITVPNAGIPGFVADYTDNSIGLAAAQVLVQAANVNIIDLAVDGTGALPACSSSTPSLVGIVYASGSSGTVKRAAIRNQSVHDGSGGYACFQRGVGIRAVTVSSLTVQDSSVRGFSSAGIEIFSSTAVLVKGNVVTGISVSQGSASNCIEIFRGGQAVDNTVDSCASAGIFVTGDPASAVTVSENTVLNAVGGSSFASVGFGIGILFDDEFAPVTITSNTVSNAQMGISADPGGNSVGGNILQYNKISAVQVGIALNHPMSTPNTVSQNTINDAQFGTHTLLVPGNNLSGNTFLNVTTLAE